MAKIKPLYLAIAIIVLLIILAVSLYFIFVRDGKNKPSRGTYVFNEVNHETYVLLPDNFRISSI